jgi:DNA repair protein RadD
VAHFVMIALRTYQSDAIEQLREGFRRRFRRQILVSPVASGKTVTLAFMVKAATERGLRCWIVAHRAELLDQISRTLELVGVAHGFVKAQRPLDRGAQVQVASIQSLVLRMESMPAPDLLIIDEAHRSVARTYVRLFAEYPNAKVVGLSATPERLDGRGLGEFYHQIVLGPPVQWLINNGYLARPVYFGPRSSLDMSGVRKVGGDYDRKASADLVDRPSITGNAVEHYRQLGNGGRFLAFCISLAHVSSVCAEFRAVGIPAETIDGTMSDQARRAILGRLTSGETRGVVSADLLIEGIDVPNVEVGILLRPTASLVIHQQSMGRILRPSPGKTRALILDHVNNVLRHGLAEEEREWSLDGHAKKKRKLTATVEARQCAACYAIFAGASCPECGSARDVQGRTIQERDGELVLLTEGELTAMREKRARKVEEWQCRTLADWQALAKKRGWASGWAWFRWKNSRWHPDRDDRHRTVKEAELVNFGKPN